MAECYCSRDGDPYCGEPECIIEPCPNCGSDICTGNNVRNGVDTVGGKVFNAHMTNTEHKGHELKAVRAAGSGGRVRTHIEGCDFGCWHASIAQAIKCIDREEARRIKYGQ